MPRTPAGVATQRVAEEAAKVAAQARRFQINPSSPRLTGVPQECTDWHCAPVIAFPKRNFTISDSGDQIFLPVKASYLIQEAINIRSRIPNRCLFGWMQNTLRSCWKI